MSPKLKKALAIAGASVLGLGVIATSALAMSGNLTTLFARTASEPGGQLRADPVTLGSWTGIQPGEVWVDKSVWKDPLQLSDEQADVVFTPDEYQFGVGLSAMARGDALASDVEFRDEIPQFMEIKSIDGLFHKNEYHTGVEFTAELASGSITTAFERAVLSRIQTGDVERLINDAKNAGLLTGDKNYIEWYGNRSNYQTFDSSEAIYLNRSYFFVGLADTAQKSMSIDVTVTRDLTTGSQKLYYSVPQDVVPVATENALDAQPIRLIYQVGVEEDPAFSGLSSDYAQQDKYTVDLFAGYGFAKYTPVKEIQDKQVMKTENVTHSAEYVTSVIMNGSEVHVDLGNNGRATLSKTGNLDIINKFSEDSVHPGTADSFAYDVLFNYEKVDVLKDTYKVAVFDAGGKVVDGSITELKLEGNQVTKSATVRLSSDQTLRIYDICPGIEVSITQTERSSGYYAISQSVDGYSSEPSVPLLDEIDPGVTSQFLYINGYQSPDGLRIPVYQTIENHPFRGQIFYDIEPLDGAPAPSGPQGNEACITWVEELDVQTKSTAFGPIVFNQAGEYKYRVTQRALGTDRLTRDKSRYDVVVTVTQGADGFDVNYKIEQALDNMGNAINATAVDKALFKGTYTIKEENYVSGLGVSATYKNGVWSEDLFKVLVTGEVTESLWPVEEVPMFSNVKEGQISMTSQGALHELGTLEINVPGIYTYYIKEDLGNSKDIKYSTVEYKLVVKAINNNGYIQSSYELFTRPDDRNTSEWTVYNSSNMKFENEYIGPEYRTLTITKDVVSRDPDDRKWSIDIELYDLDPVNLSRYDVVVPSDCTKLIQTKGFEENGKTGTAIRVTLGDGQTAVIKNIPKGIEYYVFEPESDLGDWEDSYSIPQRGNIDDNLNMVVTNTVLNKTLPFSIGGTAKLTGGTIAEDRYFKYCIEAVDNAPMPANGEDTATVIWNNENGSRDFAFGDIIFEKEGTYEYIVHQRLIYEDAGVTYDRSEYGVKVDVKRVGNTLVATPSYVLRVDAAGDAKDPFVAASGISFNEKYAAIPAKDVMFKGTASLTGDRWTGSLYYTIHGLKLDGRNDAPLPEFTVSRAVYDNVIGKKELSFGPIEFDSPGVYQYWVTQVVGTDINVTYDEGTYQYTVTVTDVGGKLEASISMDWRLNNQAPWMGMDGLSCDFNSVYTRPEIGDAEYKLYIVKDFDIDAGRSSDTVFQFELTGYDGAPMPQYSNVATGSVKYAANETGRKRVYFPVIRYTKPGTYHYTLKERNTGVTGVTYDQTEYSVDVLVKRNVNVYAAIPTFTKIRDSKGNVVNEKAGGANFDNGYNIVPDTVDLSGVVGIVNGFLYAGEFEFEIEPLNGAPAPEKLTTTVVLDGTEVETESTLDVSDVEAQDESDVDDDGVIELSVNFGTVKFDKAGVYKYRVRQVVPDDSDDMLYDLSEYEIIVNVTGAADSVKATVSFVQVKTSKGEEITLPANISVDLSHVLFKRDAFYDVDLGSDDFTVEYLQSFNGLDDMFTKDPLARETMDLFTNGLLQRVKVTNNTDEDVSDVVVSVKLPSGFVVYNSFDTEYTTTVESIKAGETVNVDLTVSCLKYTFNGVGRFAASVTCGDVISGSNAVKLTVGTVTSDPDVYVTTPNSITSDGLKTDGLKYQFVVKNAGPGVANDVVVNIPLPEGLVTNDGMAGEDSSAYYSVIDKLESGESKVVSFTVYSKKDVTIALGSYDVKAQVYWDKQETPISSNVLKLNVVKTVGEAPSTTPAPTQTPAPTETPENPEEPDRIYWENVYNQLVSVTVKKNWIMDDSLLPPVPVRAQLFGDGEPVGTPVTLQPSNGWTHTWTKLDGEKVWTVDEVGVPSGFEKTVESVGNYWTITNDDIMGDLRDGDLQVQFEWVTDHGREIPDEVIVQLYSDDVPFSEPVVLSESKKWQHTWHNLDDAHTWSIRLVDGDIKGFDKFVSVNGQVWTFKFDDTPIFPDPQNVSIKKLWSLENGREQPESIQVQLYRNGEPFDTPVTLDETNDWFFMWANLDGAYEWSVDELEIPEGFTKFVQHKNSDWEITNRDTPIEETKTVKVVKVWDNVPQWRFEPVGKPSSGDKETDEKYGLGIYGTLGETILEERPSMVPAEIKVQLMVGGAPVGDPVALNDDNGWQYAWTGLDPENDYIVKEVTQLSDYEVEYRHDGDNWAVKNTYVPVWRETLPVKILWNVTDQSTIPSSVKVQLYQNGTPYGEPVEVTKAAGWTYSFNDLPRGYVYNAVQLSVDGFITETTEDDGVIVIANNTDKGDVSKPTPEPGHGDDNKPDDDSTSRPNVTPGPDDGNHGGGNTGDGNGGNNGDNNNGGNNSGDNNDDNGNGGVTPNPDDNGNHNGTTIPNGSGNGTNNGNGSSNNGGNLIGSGVGIGTGISSNGNGTGTTTNGGSNSSTNNSNKNDNNSLANPNKNNPNTGVENNSVVLWLVLGVLAVAGLGTGGYIFARRKGLFDR